MKLLTLCFAALSSFVVLSASVTFDISGGDLRRSDGSLFPEANYMQLVVDKAGDGFGTPVAGNFAGMTDDVELGNFASDDLGQFAAPSWLYPADGETAILSMLTLSAGGTLPDSI